MSKFKIGDEIHYMDNNKPTVSKVKAILVIEGEIEVGYKKYKTEQNEPVTVYLVNYSTHVAEENAHKNLENLKDQVFGVENKPQPVEK